MRVALITGGMGGLGESISTKMHAAGYRVVVAHSPRESKTGSASRAPPGASPVPMGSTLLISTRAGSAPHE